MDGKNISRKTIVNFTELQPLITVYILMMYLITTRGIVRHSALLYKMAQLDMPDEVCNWLVSFFSGHSHCTVCLKSLPAQRHTRIYSIGPASYVVNTGDFQAVTPGNLMIKFANDTYIIIPAINANSRLSELDNVELWSRADNLKVNSAKCADIIFVDKRQPPLPITNIAGVTHDNVY